MTEVEMVLAIGLIIVSLPWVALGLFVLFCILNPHLGSR